MSAAFHGTVAAVCANSKHALGKPTRPSIRLVAGIGVDGDAHAGVTVKHRSRVRRDPAQPNLRQVHLIGCELHNELRAGGFDVGPGMMGENITTIDLDLLALPRGTRLCIGADVVIEITGLRNPCVQLDRIKPGLMKAVLGIGPTGAVAQRAGVMAVVLKGGTVHPGDAIAAWLPAQPHQRLSVV